jgi:hypothetical protein
MDHDSIVDEISKFANTENYTGIWFVIHLMAVYATTPEKKLAFVDMMHQISRNLKCEKCRSHALDYIQKYPIQEYFDDIIDDYGRDVGIFKWSWDFHNAVNKRLKKPGLEWEIAYKLYSDDTFAVCKLDCDKTVKNGSKNESKNGATNGAKNGAKNDTLQKEYQDKFLPSNSLRKTIFTSRNK